MRAHRYSVHHCNDVRRSYLINVICTPLEGGADSLSVETTKQYGRGSVEEELGAKCNGSSKWAGTSFRNNPKTSKLNYTTTHINCSPPRLLNENVSE